MDDGRGLLILRVPNEPVLEVKLDERPLTIGRDTECDVVINNRYVSRKHARLEPSGSSFALVELASTNPIFVNGERLSGSRVLATGDKIRIAEVALEFWQPDLNPNATAIYTIPPAEAAGEKELTPELTGSEHERLKQQLGLQGTLTIMFTDLENSTRAWAAYGDTRAQAYLRTHNLILRGLFEKHHGLEVKGQGDGFMVVFRSAREGVRCATEIQRELLRYNADQPALPIRVRIGMSVGEVIAEEEDFFGTSVIVAARVAAKAHAGEIFISEVLQRIVSPTGEFRIVPQGSVRLKGFTQPQRVYAVEWAEASEEPV